jgi:hypothetical protein
MDAEQIVREALRIASTICVYTNDHISVEKLDADENQEKEVLAGHEAADEHALMKTEGDSANE